MKKIMYFSLLLLVLLLFPNFVLAVGNISISTSNINVTKGKTTSFTITANNSAGKVDISSSNPNIVSVSTSSLFLDMESSKVTITGKTVGSATIKVYVADATTFDDEDLSGKTYIINVNVNEPSSNNKIDNLTVTGYNLIKVDENNYTLSVNNGVTDININAIAEHSMATVSGSGIHELDVGENNIEIIVTSESGLQNKINILVTRKDGYYIEDLKLLLEKTDLSEIDIIINTDTKIFSEDLQQIKYSEKKVRFNYYNENKKMIYSWQIDGSKINKTNTFLTTISNDSKYSQEISKLSNDADGLVINFKCDGELPNGTKIKLYVGDNFLDTKALKLYNYNAEAKTLELIKDNLIIRGGYIEFDIEKCGDYFITMSNMDILTKNDSFKTNIILIVFLVFIIVIICFIIKRFFRTKHIHDDNAYISQDNYPTNNINTNDQMNVNNYYQLNTKDK